MKTSDAFKDPPEEEDEPPEDEEEGALPKKSRKFQWHCEKGIIDNVRKLNDEFNDYRGLHPVKIFISGPPASGKSYYAEQISRFYNIPHIKVRALID